MKKFLLPVVLFFVSLATFAQDGDGDENSEAYKWGERNAIPVLLVVIVLIVVIIWAIMRRRKKNP